MRMHLLEEQDFQPRLNLFDAVMIVMGAIIGAGIFFTPQAVARVASNNLVRGAVPALLFVLVHWENQEISQGGVGAVMIYLVLGLYLSLLAIRGNGLETAFGFHLGVNFHALLLVTTDAATLETPAILRTSDPDFLLYVPVLVIICAVHYWLVFRENPLRLMRPGRAVEEAA